MSSMTRRYVLKMGVLTAATGAVTQAGGPRSASGQSKQLVVCSWGGAYQEAQRKTMFQPFEKETGIKIVEASPTDYGKLKAMVQSGNVEWDLVDVGDLNVIAGMKDNLLEPLDYQTIDTKGVFPQVVHKYGIGTIYYSTVLAYSTKKYAKGDHPKTWAQFWDAKAFPGPRTMRDNPADNLEFALLADDVPIDKIYPLDVERAFKSMDRIKKDVNVWWTTGAQPAQLLSDGEVELATSLERPDLRHPEAGGQGRPGVEPGQTPVGLLGDSARQQEQGRRHEVHCLVHPAQAAGGHRQRDPLRARQSEGLRVHRRAGGQGHADRAGKRQAPADGGSRVVGRAPQRARRALERVAAQVSARHLA